MIIDDISRNTQLFVESKAKAKRKQYGQFFTTIRIARYMASLFDIDLSKPSLRILDAGAGAGILACALVEHCREVGYMGDIELVCYENDFGILPLLSENLHKLASEYDVKYLLITDNYLTSQEFGSCLHFSEKLEFDLIIGNPPYKKIAKDAPEAKSMSSVCHGAPNLYFLFFAMGIHNLKENGQLVYIIPRSWTSGAYFERFRKYLLDHCAIECILLFGSRKKVFKEEAILQETMIIKVRKTKHVPKQVNLTYAENADFAHITTLGIGYDVVVGKNNYIYLPVSEDEISVLDRLSKLPSTLPEDGLAMKTGLIVDYRAGDVLRNVSGDDTYPIFYAQHINQGKVKWPIGKENEHICTSHRAYLQENTNYVFVKRFTAKEEKRRIQCGIYLSRNYPQFKFISTQNKLNFIKCRSVNETYGVFVLLNSSLYDLYYRILNGSTQVNSTEINRMPVPERSVIERMGSELIGKELNEQNCNAIIDRWII